MIRIDEMEGPREGQDVSASLGLGSRWVNVGGIETHYSEAGTVDGPAVLLLHGGGPGMSAEIGFAPLFRPLAERGFHVLGPDQLSFGLTDTRPLAWPVEGFLSLVEHVAAFIDQMGLSRVHLIGHSQGSYVAARYALDHPDRVGAVVLMASGTIGSAMAVPNPANRGVKAVKAYDGTLDGLRNMLAALGSGNDTYLGDRAEELFRNATRAGVAESRLVFEAARDRIESDPEQQRRFSLRDRLPGLKAPARFIWGKDDPVAPFEMAQQIADLCPDIPISSFENCGHNVMYERTDDLLEILYEMFNS